MSEEQRHSVVRSKIDRYTTSIVLAVSCGVFLTVVPFLPGAPLVPLLIGVGLGVTSLRRPVWAAGVLALLVFLAIAAQLFYFGLADMITNALGSGNPFALGASILLLLFFIVNLAGARSQPTTFALAMLAVALMMTGYYFFSIATIVIAAALGGIRSIGPVSTAFVSTMTPLLLMANALDYAANPNGWTTTLTIHPTPIVFSQLSTLARNFAPPLACFNILAGCFGGSGTLSSDALGKFTGNGAASSVLVIPLIMLAITFSSSASVAGIAHSILLKLSWHEQAGRIIRISSPLVAAVAASIAFVALISALAPIGPFRTDLVNSGTLNLSVADNIVAGALLIGAVFTAREFGIQRLERLEFARDQLIQLLQGVSGEVGEIGAIVAAISAGAPTVPVGGEEKQLQEYGAYFKDISAGLKNASYPSLQHWIKDITERVGLSLKGMPEALRIKIIDELNKLTALATTYNNMLDEMVVQLRFPDLEMRGDMTYEEALKRYGEITSGIKDATKKLFSEYSATTAAFNQLMNKELIVPPIDPQYLLETHDYPAAMKLVSEDYWVSFNLTYAADLSRKATGLLTQLQSMSELVDESTRGRMGSSLKLLPNAKPTNSREVLEAVKALIPEFNDSLRRVRLEFEQMEKLVKSLTPGTTRVVGFEILELFGAQERLAQRVQKLKSNFNDVTVFADDFAVFMTKVTNGRKEDIRNIIILSQYHLAKRYIESLAGERKTIPLADLPFQRDAVIIYVRLLAEETQIVSYDDSNEEIVLEHAKV